MISRGQREPYPHSAGDNQTSRQEDEEMAKQKDTVTVRIAGETRAVAWSGGVFAGDPDLVLAARRLAAINAEVEVLPPGGYGVADENTRQGAMIAMLGAANGRGLVVEQDDELWQGLRGDDEPPGPIY